MAIQKVLVADEAKETNRIKTYLEKTGYQTVCASSGRQALTLFDKYAPELVLLGLILPDMSGEDICQTIRAKSHTPIIMLSSETQEHGIINALRLGADDYVSKPLNPDLLVAKINAVLRRASLPAADNSSFQFNDGKLSIDERRHETKVNGKIVGLTPNEFSILIAMTKNPSKVFTRDELIVIISGDEYKGLKRVIDTHIKSIRHKIRDNCQKPRYIITVHGIGYRFGRS